MNGPMSRCFCAASSIQRRIQASVAHSGYWGTAGCRSLPSRSHHRDGAARAEIASSAHSASRGVREACIAAARGGSRDDALSPAHGCQCSEVMIVPTVKKAKPHRRTHVVLSHEALC